MGEGFSATYENYYETQVFRIALKKQQFILLVLLFAPTGFAQELANIPGMFLDVGYGARPMGMGGAYTATANDAYSIIWNPAGLTQIQGQQASFYFAFSIPCSFSHLFSRSEI